MTHVMFATTMEGLPWAGSEELWRLAALRLMGEGVSVSASLLRREPISEKVAGLERAGCRIAWRRPRGPIASRLERRLGRQDRWRVELLRRERPDLLVVSHSCLDGIGWGAAALEAGVAYAFVGQVAAEFYWPDDDEAERALAVLRGARRCFFVSRANRSLICRQIGGELPNAALVWNPFVVRWENGLAWPSEEGPLRMACVGRLDARHKGQDLLIEALSGPVWRGRDVSLSLFGAGPNERALRRMAEAGGIGGRVRFGGHVGDVESIWREHHAMVLPSRAEGMPLAVIEAMLCGRACVVTDVGGNAELVEDGRSGFVAAAPSTASVAEALERLWERRFELRAMGEAARSRARALIPEDPGGVFARELLRLLGEDGARAEPSDELEMACA